MNSRDDRACEFEIVTTNAAERIELGFPASGESAGGGHTAADTLHKATVVIDLIDDVLRIFHHLCEQAGVDQRRRQRLIQSVIVPIDLGE